MISKTSIDELAAHLKGAYSHLELAQINDHAAYLFWFKGEYPPHMHTKDEMYLVLEGEIHIGIQSSPDMILSKGESTVVRAYTTHSSGSKEGALVLMVKPKEMFGNMIPVE